MGKLVLVVAAAFAFCCALMVGLWLWERRMRRGRRHSGRSANGC
jgi:hypothetical protein